jgi:uncharacterized protein (TIGR00255 family)
VEIRSYNSRYLDIHLKIPVVIAAWEERIRNRITESVPRGRVEARVLVQSELDAAAGFEIDAHRARTIQDMIAQLRKGYDMDPRPTLDFLFGSAGVIRSVPPQIDTDACRDLLDRCVADALSQLVAMRRREGDALRADMEDRLSTIEKALEIVERRAGDMVTVYHRRLVDRIGELTEGSVEIDPSRIAQEAAILADRSDISEEIVRTRSHIHQFRDILEHTETAGRKLNFLLQELNRELNTMGSKSVDAAVTRTVVDMRSEAEKLREQVQNVQ